MGYIKNVQLRINHADACSSGEKGNSLVQTSDYPRISSKILKSKTNLFLLSANGGNRISCCGSDATTNVAATEVSLPSDVSVAVDSFTGTTLTTTENYTTDFDDLINYIWTCNLVTFTDGGSNTISHNLATGLTIDSVAADGIVLSGTPLLSIDDNSVFIFTASTA